MVVAILSEVPPGLIRSEQCGDWDVSSTIKAYVRNDCPEQSKLPVLIHELIEAALCHKSGITDKAVCDFDALFEKERAEGKHSATDEPGDDPRAPYRAQHQAATHVERAVCSALGLSWETHCSSL